MHDVISNTRFDIDELSRLAKKILPLLSATGVGNSPIRYRSIIENGFRLRAIWASHVRLSQRVQTFIVMRDPRFQVCLAHIAAEQQRLAVDLKLLTPAEWPRSTDLGLNSLRIRAFHTLPLLIQELEREELTLLPLLQQWFHGGVPTHPAIISRERKSISFEMMFA